MGFGDWAAHTKNNTYFNSPGGGTIITLANGKKYEHPYKWYFYRDHIIGIRKKNITGGYKHDFFVINEKEGVIHTFNSEAKWKMYIDSNDLNPKYWKRWYTESWNHLELILLLAIFFFPISIPIILFNIYCYYKWAKFNKDWEKWRSLATITPALILLLTILGKFPESL